MQHLKKFLQYSPPISLTVSTVCWWWLGVSTVCGGLGVSTVCGGLGVSTVCWGFGVSTVCGRLGVATVCGWLGVFWLSVFWLGVSTVTWLGVSAISLAVSTTVSTHSWVTLKAIRTNQLLDNQVRIDIIVHNRPRV